MSMVRFATTLYDVHLFINPLTTLTSFSHHSCIWWKVWEWRKYSCTNWLGHADGQYYNSYHCHYEWVVYII